MYKKIITLLLVVCMLCSIVRQGDGSFVLLISWKNDRIWRNHKKCVCSDKEVGTVTFPLRTEGTVLLSDKARQRKPSLVSFATCVPTRQ